MKTKQHGFTLIDLLIVLVIIAILVALAIPSYQRFVQNARLESLRGDLLANAQTMERYYAQHHTFANVPNSLIKQNEFFDITISDNNGNQFMLRGKANANYASQETRFMQLDSNGVVTLCTSSSNCTMY